MKVRHPQPRPPVGSRAPIGGAPARSRRRAAILRLLPAGLLGAGAAVLVSCGSSGVGLIPAENANPLVKDFQAVEQAAANGNGDCTATKAALHTTERDFQSLPASVNTGLRNRLHEGIAHLQTLALELCAQPHTTTGATTTAPSTSTTKTSSTTGETSTTGTGGATTPSATTPSSGAEGGTPPETEGNEGAAGEAGKGAEKGGASGGEAEESAQNGGAGVPGDNGAHGHGNGGSGSEQ